ncbi:unnamed protein product [Eruca vesicaria subsp. sativa]|uniref:Uncharacterized protein n=1 Tax=Eruca vesicaria subsp. sativa TaxID=29727 RepID=A0ABC8IVJ4_ERUVS|nr:unnamed protein product [Eruca vesicaria subsp. sativa]
MEGVPTELEARISRIADSLDKFSIIHDRDVTLATAESGMSEIQLFLGDAPPSSRSEEA